MNLFDSANSNAQDSNILEMHLGSRTIEIYETKVPRYRCGEIFFVCNQTSEHGCPSLFRCLQKEHVTTSPTKTRFRIPATIFEVDTQISNVNLGTRIFLHCLSYGIEGFSLEVHATGYRLEGINRIEVTQHSQTLLQGIC